MGFKQKVEAIASYSLLEKRFGGRFFEKKFGGVYVPVCDWPDSVWYYALDARLYFQAEESAPLLAKAITDEDIPLKMELAGNDVNNYFYGGRLMDALLLGMIKYEPAIPQLMEASRYDDDRRMRSEAVESIGDMNDAAIGCVPMLCDIMYYDKDVYVRSEAASSLGKIGDRRALVPLRNAFEESRYFMERCERNAESPAELTSEEWEEISKWGFLLQQSLESLVRMDDKMGREAMEKGIRSESCHVYTVSKRVLSIPEKIHLFYDLVPGYRRIVIPGHMP